MTRIAIRTAAGRARLTLTGDGPLAPRLLQVEENGARVGLVATSALLLGGDHVEIDVEVGPGAWLEIVETAGTVAYDAAGAPSSWQVRIRIADGGLLIWHAEPFVVSRGANVRRSTEIHLAEHAVACLRESLVLGRTGETGGAVRSTLSAWHLQRPLLAEDLDLTQPERGLPGIIGSARVLDTVSLLGMRAPDVPELPPGLRFELDQPGTLARCLTSGLALSPLSAVATGWAAAAAQATVSAATIL